MGVVCPGRAAAASTCLKAGKKVCLKGWKREVAKCKQALRFATARKRCRRARKRRVLSCKKSRQRARKRCKRQPPRRREQASCRKAEKKARVACRSKIKSSLCDKKYNICQKSCFRGCRVCTPKGVKPCLEHCAAQRKVCLGEEQSEISQCQRIAKLKRRDCVRKLKLRAWDGYYRCRSQARQDALRCVWGAWDGEESCLNEASGKLRRCLRRAMLHKSACVLKAFRDCKPPAKRDTQPDKRSEPRARTTPRQRAKP